VEHIKGSEKPAAILHNEKQDKMPAPAKFEDKYQCRFSPYPRPSEDKSMSGLAKFINEYKGKKGDAAPRADELWIVVTRRRSSRRSPRRRSRRREATPDASQASLVSPSWRQPRRAGGRDSSSAGVTQPLAGGTQPRAAAGPE